MLGRDMVERIENTARLSGASVLSVLASCFYITLNKLTQKTNIPLGFINSGKDSAELNNTPGNMVNTLILKQEVAENISVMEFISQTHQSIVTMRANAGVSIPCIWKDLGLQDNINIPACLNYVVVPNGIPLYESLVNEKDITFKGYPSSNLDIVIFKSDDCIVFKYNYKINMFSPANVENIEMEFRSNLLDMLDNPHGLIMTDAQLDYV
jgi:hypothetical protein